jgi:hypothetical protein
MADQQQQQQHQEPQQQDDNPHQHAVAVMAVKLPDFWTGDPETWFATADSQLCRGQILEEMTMFNHVVAKLLSDVVAAVHDIPLALPIINLTRH